MPSCSWPFSPPWKSLPSHPFPSTSPIVPTLPPASTVSTVMARGCSRVWEQGGAGEAWMRHRWSLATCIGRWRKKGENLKGNVHGVVAKERAIASTMGRFFNTNQLCGTGSIFQKKHWFCFFFSSGYSTSGMHITEALLGDKLDNKVNSFFYFRKTLHLVAPMSNWPTISQAKHK